jgi:Na+-transporting NADH:ubiquinone oxidoreductase subunit NqrF
MQPAHQRALGYGQFRETLVDAALTGWMIIPHDCRTGQCETCRVTILSGEVDDQGTGDGRTVLACLATVAGDADIGFEEVPEIIKVAGIVAEITALSPKVLEVVVATQSPLRYRPGQYVRLKFSGFPGREYSPTVRLDDMLNESELVFHIRRLPGGLISSQLGATIRVGHRVQAHGPFGHAFLRDDDSPIVLVAGGTGFAPPRVGSHRGCLDQGLRADREHVRTAALARRASRHG